MKKLTSLITNSYIKYLSLLIIITMYGSITYSQSTFYNYYALGSFLGITFPEGDYSVEQTSDGGYIVVGNTDVPNSNNSDVFLMKLNARGNATWAKTYGDSLYNDAGFAVQEIIDSGQSKGYYIVGTTNSHS